MLRGEWTRFARAFGLLGALALTTTGCDLNPYLLGGGGGGGDGDGGTGGDGGGTTIDGGGGVVDAGIDGDAAACMLNDEVCDGKDNNCNDEIDEGFDLDNDPENCGACGRRCSRPHASGSCDQGDCVDYTCHSGWVDLNGDKNATGDSNGCEYPCTPTNGGVEACDFMDNDCDGDIDEEFGVATDPNNCGGCGNVCAFLNAIPTCTAGDCGFDECVSEWDDINLNGQVDLPDEHNDINMNGEVDVYADIYPLVPGCEYRCPVVPPLDAELCNGIDDDCDGAIDNGAAGGVLGALCVPFGSESICTCSGTTVASNTDDPTWVDGNSDPLWYRCEGGTWTCEGTCDTGELTCNFGTPVCAGFTHPQTEICDDADNDCDGEKDEPFHTDTNPQACGPSCTVCDLPNAIEGCVDGECTVALCNSGWVDLDPDVPGCEYFCTPSGPELCDGRDNDCDGLTDDEDVAPFDQNGIVLQTPSNFCNQLGQCAGTVPTCTDTSCEPDVVTWRCIYQTDEIDDDCGLLPTVEQLCDGLDGDCDCPGDTNNDLTVCGPGDQGVDEAFFLLGTECDDGDHGICRGVGEYVCKQDNSGVECYIAPGDEGADPADREYYCDNVDEDCDDMVDEWDPADPPIDTVVAVDFDDDGTTDFYIDAYEASRPDATAATDGFEQHVACSNFDKMPWSNVTYPVAEKACLDAGKRLCEAWEWQEACEGGVANLLFPYGSSYEPYTCNGNQWDGDLDPGDCSNPGGDEDVAYPTGSTYGCPSDTTCLQDVWNVDLLDMSGNVQEWTSTLVGSAREVRGGSYFSSRPALTCDYDFISFAETYKYENVGFRCCTSICGNGRCEADEDNASCAADCP